MDFCKIDQKKLYYQRHKDLLRDIPDFLEQFEASFMLSYTHDSTKIEGNQLSYKQKRRLLIGGRSVRGLVREQWEVINHRRAYYYMLEAIRTKRMLDISLIHDIHRALMQNIMVGGVFRGGDMFLTNSDRSFPMADEVPVRMAAYIRMADEKSRFAGPPNAIHPIELAAWTHAEFTDIHPYPDGNGRTARLLMNFQLQRNGFVPVSIQEKDYLRYQEALKEYERSKHVGKLTAMIARYEERQLDVLMEQESILAEGW